MMRKFATQSLLAAALLCAAIGIAQQQPPAENVSSKHPNLAAAQKLCDEAYEKVIAAQKANNYDMGGHAEKAKQLLEQASQELKQAATADDKADASKAPKNPKQ